MRAGAPRLRRSIGQSASAALTFQVSQFVPADLQSDYATGKSYYDAFSHSGLSVVNGRLELSPAAASAVAGALNGVVIASVPVLGQAYGIFLALAPQAGPGQGVCITDPPAGPLLEQLRSWPHFTGWSAFYGQDFSYGRPGSFEAYANAVLEYNYLLGANCFGDKTAPAAVVLASLIATWNATHLGPARTICRSGLHPYQFAQPPPGYDPIAAALEQSPPASFFRKQAPCPPGLSDWQLATTQCGGSDYIGPSTIKMCFAINDGPLVVRPKALTLRFGSKTVPPPVAATLTARPGAGALPVLALGAAAAATWWWRKPLAKLLGL